MHRTGKALLATMAGALVLSLSACGTPTSISFSGHGYGHGRGMGQWGAYGYAVDQGWSWQQIVDRYYGGTASTAMTSVAPQRVLMRGNVNRDVVVRQERGHFTVAAAPVTAGALAVRVQRLDDSRFQLYDGPTCGGPWTPTTVVTGAEVEIAPTLTASEDRGEMLQLCEASGERILRGSVLAVHTSGAIQTVNRVGTEPMLRSVIAREMSPGWSGAGNGRGFQALAAQAVAGRSYLGAGDTRWLPIATTCDTTYCQAYSGVAFHPAGSSAWSVYEDPRTDLAVAATAGIVRTFPSGRIAATEYSASTGGWTKGPTFTPVADDGDATSANPNHSWSVTMAASSIEAVFDQRQGRDMGALLGLDVVQRDGRGADGGRPTSVVARFAGGDVTLTGDQVRSTLGLKSDWFTPTPN